MPETLRDCFLESPLEDSDLFGWKGEGGPSYVPWVVVAVLGTCQGIGRVGRPSSEAVVHRSILSLKKQVKYYQLFMRCSSSTEDHTGRMGRSGLCHQRLWRGLQLWLLHHQLTTLHNDKHRTPFNHTGFHSCLPASE